MVKVEILYVNKREGVKDGRPWMIAEADALVFAPDVISGQVRPHAGKILLPRGEEDLKPGTYDAQFTISTDDRGKLVPRFYGLKPSVALTVGEKRGAA